MAGLKELRGRIEAIKSTEKITSAMKMVAASRLRRAQDVLDKSAAYRDNLYAAAGRTWRFVWRKDRQFCRKPKPFRVSIVPGGRLNRLQVFKPAKADRF